jgi:sterol desaturase/sphingolipid hydroxylase (fatty acid hydroxylase superfamily)
MEAGVETITALTPTPELAASPAATPTATPVAASRVAGLRGLYLPTVAVAVLVAWLAWRGWSALAGYGPLRSIRAGQFELAGPVVLGFVLVVVALEQIWPAQRRPVLARGHVLDMAYLMAHALLVVPMVVLIGTGFSSTLERLAPWLVLPHTSAVPRWLFVALAVVAIDAVDWFAHLINHKINSLWRLHALHHSQEELSVLTTFRTHPLVHVTFVLSAVPVLALASNAATPTVLLTAYACLGALPHANLRWSYGPLDKVLCSPVFHRAHHRPVGRLDINLGTVFSIWDVMSGRAVFPVRGAAPAPTGLSGRPIPVEQQGERPRLARVFLSQWIEPFTTK